LSWKGIHVYLSVLVHLAQVIELSGVGRMVITEYDRAKPSKVAFEFHTRILAFLVTLNLGSL